MKSPDKTKATIPQNLGFWDALSIIVGIVVGTAIFRSSTLVFQNTSGLWQALAAWLLGGFLCLIGGLCYAELATTYPRNGGDYEYLGRAYGPWMGFLFGWAQLAVILTASIGAMAYIFADYGAKLWGLGPAATAWLAVAAVGVLSAMNLCGVVVGKSLQNVLTAAKVLGLLGIIAVGVTCGQAAQFSPGQIVSEQMSLGQTISNFGLAMVFVLYAFGGWNDAVFVAAEVRDQHRNLPLAILLGIAGITVVYLAVNASYLAVLGFDAARQTGTPASDVLAHLAGPWGGNATSILVMISALGAINGMIFAGARVYATVGEDHRAFALLGRWNTKAAVPAAAIIAQACIAISFVFAVGTTAGRAIIDGCLTTIGLAALPWQEYFGGFETLVTGTAPVFWIFFLLTGLSVFVLRIKDGSRIRPFRIPLYPIPPIIFSLTCIYMLWSSLLYARTLALLGAVPLLVGLPIYLMGRKSKRQE